MKHWIVLACLGVLAAPGGAQESLPRQQYAGTPELIATFNGPMLTGVTVSKQGRMFVIYPRWGENGRDKIG